MDHRPPPIRAGTLATLPTLPAYPVPLAPYLSDPTSYLPTPVQVVSGVQIEGFAPSALRAPIAAAAASFAPASASSSSAAPENISLLSTAELRTLIQGAGLSCEGVCEKDELRLLAKQAAAAQAAAAKDPGRSAVELGGVLWYSSEAQGRLHAARRETVAVDEPTVSTLAPSTPLPSYLTHPLAPPAPPQVDEPPVVRLSREGVLHTQYLTGRDQQRMWLRTVESFCGSCVPRGLGGLLHLGKPLHVPELLGTALPTYSQVKKATPSLFTAISAPSWRQGKQRLSTRPPIDFYPSFLSSRPPRELKP